MRYIKIIAIFICVFLFAQCSVIRPTSQRKVEKEISEYKLMTEYIICKNYHDNFESKIVLGINKAKETDSLIFDFMRRKNIVTIYITKAADLPRHNIKYGDHIEYAFKHIPIFGKQRQLIFDSSDDVAIQNKYRRECIVIEEGIYYIEF